MGVLLTRLDIHIYIYTYIYTYIYIHIYISSSNIWHLLCNQQKGDWTKKSLGIAWYVFRYHGLQLFDQRHDNLAVELYSIITRTNVCGLPSQEHLLWYHHSFLGYTSSRSQSWFPVTISQQDQNKCIKTIKNLIKTCLFHGCPQVFCAKTMAPSQPVLNNRSCRTKGSRRSTVWRLSAEPWDPPNSLGARIA
jgi:hypothetical protein